MNDLYTTLEGFCLPRELLLPNARTFGDVLEYLGEWNAEASPEPRYIPEETPNATAWERKAWRTSHGRNEIGPYCTIDLSQIGGPSHRSVAVRATDAVIEAVAPRIVTPDDHLTFRLIAHGEPNRVLVTLEHGYIIGSHWLAYIDPATIPEYPFKRRDERYAQICESLREDGMEPFVKRAGFEIEVRAITGREPGTFRNIFHPNLKAVIHEDGAITRTWTDGTVSEEPA